MRKLFIHVGTHKAGSTTIQRFLGDNEDLLVGHFYHFRNSYHLGARFMKNLVDIRDVPVLRQQLNDLGHLSGHDRLFFSGEGFFGRPDDGYANGGRCAALLRECTADFDVRIIVIVRQQIPFLESLYQQAVKQGGWTSSFGRYLDSVPWQRFDWNALITEGYERAFGRENVTVIPFESFSSPNANPVWRILEMLGLPGDHLGPVPRYNVSLSRKGLELMKGYNATHGGDESSQRTMFRKHLEREHPKPKGDAPIASPEERSMVEAAFHVANMALATRYDISEWGALPTEGPAGRSENGRYI